MLRPLGNVNESYCGLMFVALDAGRLVEPVHLDLVVEVADVADDRLVLHPPRMCSRVMTSQLPVVVT